MEQLNEDNILYFLCNSPTSYIELIFLKVTKLFFKERLKAMIWSILGKQSKH